MKLTDMTSSASTTSVIDDLSGRLTKVEQTIEKLEASLQSTQWKKLKEFSKPPKRHWVIVAENQRHFSSFIDKVIEDYEVPPIIKGFGTSTSFQFEVGNTKYTYCNNSDIRGLHKLSGCYIDNVEVIDGICVDPEIRKFLLQRMVR